MTLCTQAEYARVQGVSRKTVTEWKSRGYVKMIGDRVDVEASNRALAGAGRSRLNPVTLKPKTARNVRKGNTAGIAATRTGNTQALIGDRPWTEEMGHQHAADFPHVSTLACCVSAAGDLYLALLDHLPPATARPLAERIVAKVRADAVEILDDDGEFPPGFTSWADHPWFTRPALTEAEWREVEAEWRVGGLPSPVP